MIAHTLAHHRQSRPSIGDTDMKLPLPLDLTELAIDKHRLRDCASGEFVAASSSKPCAPQ
jgi:hypothetical protein